MITQQQATQGLFRSPGENKQILTWGIHKFGHIPLVIQEKYDLMQAYLFWHTSRKFLEA